MFNFKDKSVLISGTAKGCGSVIAKTFAEQGPKVAGCELNDAGGKETLAIVEPAGTEGLNQRGAFLCMSYEVEAMRKPAAVPSSIRSRSPATGPAHPIAGSTPR